MVSRVNLLSLAGRNSSRLVQTADGLMPKAAITVGIALLLLAIGFTVAKLLDCWHNRVRDDVSDLSDHTRRLLRLQKSTRRRSLLAGNGGSRLNMTEEERRQWQLTVLSMWQSQATVEDDESLQDHHTLMLSRLRSAWLNRRKAAAGTAAAATAVVESSVTAAATGTGNGSVEIAEDLQMAGVRRVALAWLASSRASRQARRQRASHQAMMRRLSWAWRLHNQVQMRTIDEAGDQPNDGSSDGDSFITVDIDMPDWAGEDEAAGILEIDAPQEYKDAYEYSKESDEPENAEKAAAGHPTDANPTDSPGEGQVENGAFCQLL